MPPSEGKVSLKADNERLRDVNDDLRRQVEDLEAMVEALREQVSGRTGLLADPTRSPILNPSTVLC